MVIISILFIYSFHFGRCFCIRKQCWLPSLGPIYKCERKSRMKFYNFHDKFTKITNCFFVTFSILKSSMHFNNFSINFSFLWISIYEFLIWWIENFANTNGRILTSHFDELWTKRIVCEFVSSNSAIMYRFNNLIFILKFN